MLADNSQIVTQTIISTVCNLRAILQGGVYMSLLGLSFRLFLPRLARQPGSREEEESHAGADSAGVVWPCSTKESWVAVVAGRDNGDSGRAVEVRPSWQY